MNIQIPYSDFKQLEEDSVKLADVKKLLVATFPDDTCQLIAIKSVLEIEESNESDSE